MMDAVLFFSITLALPLAVGWAFLRALGLRLRTDALAFGGWAWCAGAFFTGLVVFAWLWTQPDTGSPTIPALALALLTLVFFVASRKRAPLESSVLPASQPLERAAFQVTTALVFLASTIQLLVGTLRPIVEDDEANFWALKAQMLFAHNGFTEAFRAVATSPNRLYNADYPILNPCLQVWSFANSGELTHVMNRVPIQLFGLALVLILAAALRRVVRPGVAALLLVAYASVSEFGSQLQRGHGDLMVGLGALIACDAWLRWKQTEARPWFGLAFFGLGFMLWSKNEGLLFFAALLGAALLVLLLRPSALRTLRPRAAWLWGLLPLAVVLLNHTLNTHFGWVSGFMAGAERDATVVGLLVEQFPARFGTVVSYYWSELVLERSFSAGLLILFLGLWLLFPGRLGRSRLLLPSLTIAAVYAGYMLVFIGAPHDITWHLTTAAQRVGFQPLAVTALCVGAGAARVLPMLGLRPGA